MTCLRLLVAKKRGGDFFSMADAAAIAAESINVNVTLLAGFSLHTDRAQ